MTGPGALDLVQRLAMRQMDVPIGRNVYTPILTESGGFKQDLTIMRLATTCSASSRAVPTGCRTSSGSGTTGPADGSAQVHEQTTAWCTLGLWGSRARDILESVTGDDVSHEGFPFAVAGRARSARKG